MTTARKCGALVLLLLLQLPFAGLLVPGSGVSVQIGREVMYWGCAVLLVGYILVIERRDLASIGLRRPRWSSVWIGIAAAAVMIAGMAFIYLVVYPAFDLADATQSAPAEALPLALLLLVVLRAAVFEELVYRGFAIERLTEITGMRWLAALVSVAAFTYAHLSYWGWAHLLVAGFGGLVLTGLYLWRRDLVTTMIAHFLTDVVGVLLGAI